jgi:hypothetical protein
VHCSTNVVLFQKFSSLLAEQGSISPYRIELPL